MSTPFPFGSQYLRGLTPHPEDWELDLARMKALGFTHVRAWLVWGVLEPSPGEIDVNSVRGFLDLAQARGLKVILLFHLHGCPEWAIRSQRACWYVDKRGQPFEPQARSNTPSGGWPGLCPDHAIAASLEEKFIKAMVTRLGSHPALAAWEPMNEPHMWVDTESSPPGVFCYCEATRSAFRGWLKARYGTLEALGRSWGRPLRAWDDVRPPTWQYGFSDWCDWRTFAAESICAHVRRRAEVIRAHSGVPVMAHAWGGGTVLCPDLGAMAFDDWKQAEVVDVWGCSGFPRTLPEVVSLGLSLDSTRSAAAGRPFWQAELGAGDLGSGLDRAGRVPPEWLALWSWESVRHGVKGLLYWQFRKERQGSELGAYGLTDYAGEATPNAVAAAAVGASLNRHAEAFLAAVPEPAQVALLFSYQSRMVDWAQHRHCRLSRSALAGYYHLFWQCSTPVDILHDERLDAAVLSRYRLVILPMPVCLAAGVEAVLTEYVRQGGCLLSDPYLCALTPDRELDTCVPGRGLDRLFGCREDDIRRAAGAVALSLPDGRHGVVRGSPLQAAWVASARSEVVASYADGSPAVLSHRVGAGRAVLSGVHLGVGWSPEVSLGDDLRLLEGAVADDIAAEIVLDCASDAGVRSTLRLPDGVVASLLEVPDGRAIVVAMNLRPEPVRGVVAIEHRAVAGATRIDGPADVPAEISADGLALELPGLGCGVFLLTP